MMQPLFRQIHDRFFLTAASHMTHTENLRSIFHARGLLAYNKVNNLPHTDLSNEDVQRGRSEKIVPPTGRPLHDYVPLYFGLKTPMVACNQAKNEDLIFLRFSLDILAHEGVVFTDGNARSNSTKFYLFNGIESLSVLDAKVIQSVKYSTDPEMKRKKQAEILVPDFLSIDQVHDITTFSNLATEKVLKIMQQFDIKKPLRANEGFYFRSNVHI